MGGFHCFLSESHCQVRRSGLGEDTFNVFNISPVLLGTFGKTFNISPVS